MESRTGSLYSTFAENIIFINIEARKSVILWA